MIKIQDLTIAYGSTVPVDAVTGAWNAPVTVVEGPSGSGKSSLLRVLGGLQSPVHGTILIDGLEVRPATWRTVADDRVALIHQDHELVDFLRVDENLLLAAELRDLVRSKDDVIDTLDRVGLGSEFAARMPASLSGGERQRVAIGRALICEVRVLLADEPTGALDAANTSRVATVLQEVAQGAGVQVVVATHDPIVADVADERWHLASGALERV